MSESFDIERVKTFRHGRYSSFYTPLPSCQVQREVLHHMSELKDKISLPFNKVKQRAVLGHILTNPSFFLQCRAQIKPNWFSEELLSAKIYKIQCEWFDRHGYAPSVEEVASCPAVMSEPIPEQTKIRNHIQLCLSEMTKFGLDAIRAELTEWLRAVVFREALETATKAYNRGLFNQVDAI